MWCAVVSREGEQEERAGLLKAERAWNSPEMERNQLSTQMRPSRFDTHLRHFLSALWPIWETTSGTSRMSAVLSPASWWRLLSCRLVAFVQG